MSQPAPLLVVLVLLAGAAARAQPALTREPRQRTVTVTGNPADLPHEVHLSHETPTVFLFGTEIRKASLRVDTKRIHVVDAGELSRSIIVQAASPFGEGERHTLEVEFTDGKAPARAAFVLVAPVSAVDTLINVARQQPPAPACDAEVRARCSGATQGPEDFVLLGYVDTEGVRTAILKRHRDDARGFMADRGVSYRGKGWALIEMRVKHLHGPQPWTPSEVTLTSTAGERLRVRLVTDSSGAIAPGEDMRVLVVLEDPPPDAGLVATLEVRGTDGRGVVIPKVEIPARAMEGSR